MMLAAIRACEAEGDRGIGVCNLPAAFGRIPETTGVWVESYPASRERYVALVSFLAGYVKLQTIAHAFRYNHLFHDEFSTCLLHLRRSNELRGNHL